MSENPAREREAVSNVCNGIRSVRAQIAVSPPQVPLESVDTLLSVALSDAEQVLTKLSRRPNSTT